MFTLGILLVLAPKLSLQQQCNSASDLGQTECVDLTIYTGYQWATCLTEDYIMRASAGRYTNVAQIQPRNAGTNV